MPTKGFLCGRALLVCLLALMASPASHAAGMAANTTIAEISGDHELYAALLSAFHAGSTVTLVGMDQCNEFGSIESLRSMNVLH